MNRLMTRLLAAVCSVSLGGCVVVDQFGDRAVAYNVEAEKTRNQILLLNIIRAAYHKPMQFSIQTTVTGSATATAGLSTVLPLGGPASGYQINPGSNSLSGGPTFTVANQVDKEFYEGILTPISLQTVDSLFKAGYPRQLLLTLFVSQISLSSGSGESRLIRNSAVSGPERFQEVLDSLLNEGLSTESVGSSDKIGPILTAAQASNLDGITKLQAQGLSLTPVGGPGAARQFQVTKSSSSYRFCFDRSTANYYRNLQPATSAALHQNLVALIGPGAIASLACGGKADEAGDAAAAAHKGTGKKRAKPAIAPAPAVGLDITIRNTLGIIYYLGEIARGQLGLARSNGSVLPGPTLLFRGPNADAREYLFRIRRGSGDPTLSVAYDGTSYTIAADPGTGDHSSQVLDLVEQLSALNSSAKDLPSSNVVNLVAH